MQISITPPSEMEITALACDAEGIKITPLVLRQQHMIRVAYLKAMGANGMVAKAVLLFNANTGVFSAQPVDTSQTVPAFDRTVAEFQSKIAAAKAKGHKRQGTTGDADVVPSKNVH